ncbi:putative adipose-regulatory protein (Seipin) family protein [Aspergillus niger]|uniref:Putative adipose-regulatory protein (Seipin) family protein n=1 Tax=Aspergillus niger TaxID=5061 RepID=A0A505I9D0_ASPNG|nr:putative adipose-regulatory protein (Seipin) family protein [Aspergillus niger]
MPRPRRSNRASSARTKYIHDPFEAAGFSDEGEGPATSETPQRRKGKGKAKQAVADEEVDAGSRRQRKKPAAAAMPKPSSSVKRRRPDGSLAVPGEETHSRGSWNPLEHVGKAVHLRVTFGTDERDILSIISARDRWYKGVDSTFPTRESLNESHDMPDYGYGNSFGLEAEDMKRESSRAWDWYYSKDVGAHFRKRQRIQKIKENEARSVYFPSSRGPHTVLAGPVDEQKVFSLAQHDVLDFGEAWEDDASTSQKQGKQAGKQAKTKQPERKRRKREGWLLNLGNKVQCLAWVPNQTGLTQYLSVVAPILPDQKEQYPDPYKDQAAPAFRPSAPYPSALQLWELRAEEAASPTKTIDMTSKPRLRLALCTDWGDLRRMAWCPMPRDPRNEDDKDAQKIVGLLAGVWGDGRVRVIDVKLSRDPNQTEYYKLQSPVFEAKPHSTVCTSVTWLSPSDIAVGCANGFVAIWSIVSSPSSPSNPIPYFYQQLHSTWILNLASAYPTHPYLISTTSMDGESRLTSVIDPQKDSVNANRMRVGTAHLTYSPLLHSFVSGDENDFLRLLAIRRFFTSTAVARLPSMISALGPCSFWHPSLLVGCTGGTVQATNPLRRMMHAKEKQWQQTWFQHEWVRGSGTGTGTSRFHDGYRAEHTSLLRNLVGDPRLINGTAVITVFDEETHVTALSWNPNRVCAGWAAAGMGCGLVRVEDLALS